MTDNEIIKGLECCIKVISDCNNCPYYNDDDCENGLIGNALILINGQKAEIEALVAGQETLQKHIKNLNADIDRLEQNLNGINIVTKNHIKVIRTQAIKYFADRLKEKFGIADCIVTIDNDDIDNLVKEMEEVNENDRA